MSALLAFVRSQASYGPDGRPQNEAARLVDAAIPEGPWDGRIERASADGLSKEVWTFWLRSPTFSAFGSPTLVVDSWERSNRPSTRHKFRTVEAYERIRSRRDHADPLNLPADVAEEALALYRASIRVSKEDVR